jgi:hypothetical protein
MLGIAGIIAAITAAIITSPLFALKGEQMPASSDLYPLFSTLLECLFGQVRSGGRLFSRHVALSVAIIRLTDIFCMLAERGGFHQRRTSWSGRRYL